MDQIFLLNRIKRVTSIGIGTMAGPGILFALPYFLDLKQFANFASVLAISQLIMSIGGFGLDVSCPRLAIHLKRAAGYCTLATLTASVVVFFVLDSHLSIKFMLGSLIAWCGSLTAIFHSYSLFAGRPQLYGAIGFTKALVFLAIFISCIYCGIMPELAWFLAAISGLLVALFLLLMNGGVALLETNVKYSFKDVIRLSAPLAIIVAGSAMPFVLDRAIGQQILNATEFSRYAVAVTWAAPVIYMGNIAYQSMIATKQEATIKTIFFWGLGIFAFGVIYFICVVVLILHMVNVPYFLSSMDFINLWGWIAGWYIIYSSIGFPVAAVMQKSFSASQLKSLAYATTGFMVLSLIISYGLYKNIFSLMALGDMTKLIIIFTGFLAMAGTLPKIIYVFKYLSR